MKFSVTGLNSCTPDPECCHVDFPAVVFIDFCWRDAKPGLYRGRDKIQTSFLLDNIPLFLFRQVQSTMYRCDLQKDFEPVFTKSIFIVYIFAVRFEIVCTRLVNTNASDIATQIVWWLSSINDVTWSEGREFLSAAECR